MLFKPPTHPSCIKSSLVFAKFCIALPPLYPLGSLTKTPYPGAERDSICLHWRHFFFYLGEPFNNRQCIPLKIPFSICLYGGMDKFTARFTLSAGFYTVGVESYVSWTQFQALSTISSVIDPPGDRWSDYNRSGKRGHKVPIICVGGKLW